MPPTPPLSMRRVHQDGPARLIRRADSVRLLASCVAVAIAVGAVTAIADAGGPSFSDVTAASGMLEHYTAAGMASGAAIADADGDGDHDIYVPAGLGSHARFYLNDGHGSFTDVAAELGLERVSWNDRAALFLDYDGDRDLDLLLGADDHTLPSAATPSTLTLFRRDADGTYTDVTAAAGLFFQAYEHGEDFMNHLAGLAAGDLDGDGWLDIVQTHWRGYAFVFMNRGDGTFEEESGIRGLGPHWDTYWQPVLCDFDGDGALDIFSAVDFTSNRLYANQGDGTFVDLAPTLGVDNEGGNDMGVALGDSDGDGDLDIFVSNIFGPKYDRNHLWRNDSTPGTLAFADVTDEAGVADTGWGWGASFGDLDHDARSDLLVTNGYLGYMDLTCLFHQQPEGSPRFSNVAFASGIADIGWGSAILTADLDGDLDLDTVQVLLDNGAAPRVWRNNLDGDAAGQAHAIVVRPRMEGRNHFAIGATVRAVVTTGDGPFVQARVITAGTSTLGQEPAEAHFGLGMHEELDRLEIAWPGGSRTVLRGVDAGRVLTVMRWACPGDADESGAVDQADIAALLAAWGATDTPRADANGDGLVDVADLLLMLAAWGACG